MPSAREKAWNYNKEVRGKLGFTKSQFGKTGRNIDSESEKPKLAQESFVNRPKPQQEREPSKSDSIIDEVKSIEERKDKEETDRSDFKKTEGPATVRQAPAITNDELISKHRTGGAFIKAWTIVDHVVIPAVIQPRKSWFYPNYIIGEMIQNSMDRCLDGNEELRWISPNYFSLAVRLYYSVLFYIQIMKAKEAVKMIGRSESTWFRAFKRNFPLESLPVVGPMVPYFANIVSVKPNDDKYDFIFPDYITNQGLRVENGVPNIDPIYFITPNITILAEFLRQFCNLTKTQLEHVENNRYDYFDLTEAHIPHTIGSAFEFAGIEFPAALTVATSSTLSNVGMDRALSETRVHCTNIHPYWQRSRTRNIPAVGKTYNHTNIGDAMRMTESFEWFEECIHMATIQCKFFSDSTNMSQIPSTGGSEMLLSANITGRHEAYEAATSWYPEHWYDLKSGFRTTRADTGPDQFANATYSMTLATISWKVLDHPIGGRQIGHRSGPYWDDKVFEYKTDSDTEVGRRIQTMITSQFYEAKGSAS